MKKCVYRNFYWIKETILDFFRANKKRLFLSVIAIVLGAVIGLCVAVRNSGSFTFINCSDKTILTFFCDGKALTFFLKKILFCLLIVVAILIINNFNFLAFLNYILFAYLAFRLVINSAVFCFCLGITGLLYVLLCYFLINISIIFLYVVIFMVCKSSTDSCGGSNKMSSYPLKAILMMYFIIVLLCLIMTILLLIFSKFIAINV